MMITKQQIEFYAALLTAPSLRLTARLVSELLRDLGADDLAAVQKRARQIDPVRLREIDRMIQGGGPRLSASGEILYFPQPKAGG
jgi:hypothetical protein